MDRIEIIHTEKIGMPYDDKSNWISSMCGTCHIWWGEDESIREIFGLGNSQKGNGDFEKAVKWFEDKCREDGKTLYVIHFENERLMKHFIEKRGYTLVGLTCVMKKFKLKIELC